MKKCVKCGKEKPINEYYNHNVFTDGKSARCRECLGQDQVNARRTKNGLISYIYINQKQRSKKNNWDIPTYSRNELRDWCYSQKKFHELYDEWKISGYKKEKIPSCNRIDDYKSYSLTNIILMTWEENNKKGWFDRKNGINNKANRAVMGVHNETGEIISFHSLIEASRQTEINLGNIHECCTGKNKNRKSAGNYKWSFIDSLN